MSNLAEPALPSPDGRRHIAALDGIRGLAILLVMFFHMTNLQMLTKIDSIWFGLASFGASGVNLFFVLSGYLITGILLDAKGQPHYFRNFYMRRVLRIFPLYYLVVFVSLVILPRLHVPGLRTLGSEQIWYWLFLSNFSIAYHNTWQHQILDVTWSLSIEEQFYLVWPALVLLCGRRTLLWICGGLIVLSLACRAALIAKGYNLIQLITLTPCRLDGLAAGAAIAVLIREGRIEPILQIAKLLVWPVLAYLLWTHRTIWVWDDERSAYGYVAAWDRDSLSQILGPTGDAIVFGSMLVVAVARPAGTWAGFLSQRWLGVFGRFSYALYLVHLPLRAALRDKLYGPTKYLQVAGSPLLGQLLFYALTVPVSLAVAWASWHLFEKHFLKLKRLFPTRFREREVEQTLQAHDAPVTDQTAHRTQSHSA